MFPHIGGFDYCKWVLVALFKLIRTKKYNAVLTKSLFKYFHLYYSNGSGMKKYVTVDCQWAGVHPHRYVKLIHLYRIEYYCQGYTTEPVTNCFNWKEPLIYDNFGCHI